MGVVKLCSFLQLSTPAGPGRTCIYAQHFFQVVMAGIQTTVGHMGSSTQSIELNHCTMGPDWMVIYFNQIALLFQNYNHFLKYWIKVWVYFGERKSWYPCIFSIFLVKPWPPLPNGIVIPLFKLFRVYKMMKSRLPRNYNNGYMR